MAKRAHWTTEQVLEEVMSDEEPVEQDLGDWELDGDDRGEVDRDEPVMEGSDEEFSDFELMTQKVGFTGRKNTQK